MDQPATILDIDFGMSQLSGNKPLLLVLLNKFSDEYRSLDDNLQKHIAQGEFDQAYSLMHTIKGVSGNLGLFALHQAAKPVEACIRNEKRLPDNYSAFINLLDETLTTIAALSDTDSQPAPPQSKNSVEAENAYEQLMAALKSSEFISQSRLDEWLNALNLPANTKQAIENAIDELEYDQAIAQLTKYY